jgi:hypothetical protein
MTSVKCIYRISDSSYKKDRLENATKKNCLENFLEQFENVIIVADNVNEKTLEWLSTYNKEIIRTYSQGNGFSFNNVLNIALDRFPDDYVYFVEDDYLHVENSEMVLMEGLEIADYVSLYDHVDKYIPSDKGGNPFIDRDGGEVTKVYATKTVHWKLTNSTTCTFATNTLVLKEDIDIWRKFTNHKHPNDFACFLNLREKGRSLITPLPSYSTHCDINWLAPIKNWSVL